MAPTISRRSLMSAAVNPAADQFQSRNEISPTRYAAVKSGVTPFKLPILTTGMMCYTKSTRAFKLSNSSGVMPLALTVNLNYIRSKALNVAEFPALSHQQSYRCHPDNSNMVKSPDFIAKCCASQLHVSKIMPGHPSTAGGGKPTLLNCQTMSSARTGSSATTTRQPGVDRWQWQAYVGSCVTITTVP